MAGLEESRSDFRAGVLELQRACLIEVESVLSGTKEYDDVTKMAHAMIGKGIRVDDIIRMETENAASLTMRFISMLEDPKARADYIKKTAPRLPAPLNGQSAKKGKK